MRSEEADPADGKTVTFVNTFTLHAPPEEFERAFAETSEFMVRQPGFLEHTLVRPLGRADVYINIAHWADPESFRNATRHEQFRPHAEALRALSTSSNHLCETRLRGLL